MLKLKNLPVSYQIEKFTCKLPSCFYFEMEDKEESEINFHVLCYIDPERCIKHWCKLGHDKQKKTNGVS